jgi:hypothetical protein
LLPPRQPNEGAALPISREELVRRLAEVSHLTYIRQKNRDHGVPLDELTLDVTDHDRERAEDTVTELERLGVYREPLAGEQPDDGEPSDPPEADVSPQTKSRREQVTDIWGNPLGKRRGRRR